jgi:hypothetical protein
MVSGLPPGRPAVTWMVGKSTCGSDGNDTRPAKARAAIINAVATGRRMKGSEIFTAHSGRRQESTQRGWWAA